MDRHLFFSSKFHYSFGPHAPTLRVQSGARLRVVCPDSDNELSDGTLLPPDQRHREPGTVLFEGNPMAGPVFIEGAVPGDCVSVRIEAIHLDRVKGQTGLAPGHGLLFDPLASPPREGRPVEPVPRHLYLWEIDTVAGVARLANRFGDQPIEVQLDPFVGCIGVCPEWGQVLSTLLAGSHGGNMDIPLVRPGTAIHLPVYRDGALLMMGDIHAAQGHGEIIGGAIETSGRIDCIVTLTKGAAPAAPRITDPGQWVAIGVDGELRSACRRAYAHLLDWLVDALSLNRWDAYNLISQTGRLTVGGLTMAPYVVAAGIPLAALPAAVQEKARSWPG